MGLRFADRFDMQSLRKAYVSAANEKMPPGIDTIAYHLGMARATNDVEKRKELIQTYFTTSGKPTNSKLQPSVIQQFLALDAQDASEVLAHDELAIGHPGHESTVLYWFKEWVACANKIGRS